MLGSRGNFSRGGRSASTSSRGDPLSRGRGRGAVSSSSKLPFSAKAIPNHGPKQGFESRRHDAQTVYGPPPISSNYKITNSRSYHLGNPSAAKPSGSFDKERSENAAKREQREHRGQQNGILHGRGARGSTRDRLSTKTVRFTSPPEEEQKNTSNAETMTFRGQRSKTTPFKPRLGSISTGTPASQTPINPFGQPFHQPLQSNIAQRNPFDVPSGSPFTIPKPGLFGNAGALATSSSSVFGRPSLQSHPSISSPNESFKPKTNGDPPSNSMQFDTTKTASPLISISNRSPQATQNSSSQLYLVTQKGPPQSRADTLSETRGQAKITKSKLGLEIAEALRKNGIFAPSWPKSGPGDSNWKAAMETFWHTTKAYRAKVRTYLMQNNLLDDPDKPKKLSDAIDFKGTCDDMCPEFEKVTRIIEHDVHNAEKELSSDGKTYWPALDKMIKANARSAAGQDAPLPEDVRTPTALRQTLDYLIDIVLGTNDLPKVHGFLWDRTRAIRRDFVFQQASMTSDELSDQVYCLELTARFHVVALHQMSHEDNVAEDFSEQQEVEQLGKTLLSLVHAYEDCMAQGIYCENEHEFRAYYIVFNSQDTGILEAVQDWGWRNWGESGEIRTAVRLVEALQNIWDRHGPLTPSATEIAPNVYNRYFNILLDRAVSYTMACFAEIHLNQVRKAALKTILNAYRKQRDQTKDWSLGELNRYLHFDDEMDILEFGEAYGLRFEVVEGQTCLSLELEESIFDPFPKLKQPHSYNLVERKRGTRSLLEVIHQTTYEDSNGVDDGNGAKDEDEGFFIPDSAAISYKQFATSPPPEIERPHNPLDDDPIITDEPLAGSSEIGTFSTNPHGQDEPMFSAVNRKSAIETSNNTAFSFNVARESATEFSKTGEIAKRSIFSKAPSGLESVLFSYLNQPTTSVSPPSVANILQPPTTFSPFLPLETAANQQFLAPSKSQFTVDPATRPILVEGEGTKAVAPLKRSESVSEAVEAQDARLPTNANPTLQKIQFTTCSTNTNPDKEQMSQNITGHRPAKSLMPAFAEWIAVGREGLFDQFTEYTVENILKQTITDHLAEETRKREQEEEMKSLAEAARFRSRELAIKYGYRWRELAHRLWMKRKGRLAREARRQMAQESFRASRDANGRHLNLESSISGRTPRRHSANQVSGHKNLIKAILLDDRTPKSKGVDRGVTSSTSDAPNSSDRHFHNTNGGSTRRSPNSQEESDNSLRRSLLSKSAYLQGGSRIHLLPEYSLNTKGHRQPSGVKTDYFRLKARGVATLPHSSPLTDIATVHVPRPQWPQNDIGKPTTSMTPNSISRTINAPSMAVAMRASPLSISPDRDDDIEVSKAWSGVMLEHDGHEKQKAKKRALDNDDEELFAKAKRIREQMDEGVEWFRAELQKSMSRSVS